MAAYNNKEQHRYKIRDGARIVWVTSVQYKGKLPFQQQKVTERSAFWVKNLWGPQQSHNILEGGGMDIIVVLWFT